MKVSDYRLGFIGFGHMAQILMHAFQAAKLIPNSQVLFHRRDPVKARENEQKFHITSTSLEQLVKSSDLLCLCIRPIQAEAVLQQLANMNAGSKKILSVVAGLRLSFLQKYVGDACETVRIMPNIASEIQEGMSLVSFGSSASAEFRSAVRLLFGSLGQVVEIAEFQMDMGTALAGCGPGFVLELIEAMARLAEQGGIPYEKALKIAAQAFAGAALLVREGRMPQDLLERIATPGGVTQVGLSAMRDAGAGQAFLTAVQAAERKSKELSETHFK